LSLRLLCTCITHLHKTVLSLSVRPDLLWNVDILNIYRHNALDTHFIDVLIEDKREEAVTVSAWNKFMLRLFANTILIEDMFKERMLLAI